MEYEKLAAYIDKNEEYYVKELQEGEAEVRKKFNWAAFFLSMGWLGYRKLYKQIFIIQGIWLAFDIFAYLTFYSDGLTTMIGLVVALIVGWYGNLWIEQRGENQIHRINQESINEEDKLEKLRKVGSASWIGVFIGLGIVLLFVIASILIGELINMYLNPTR